MTPEVISNILDSFTERPQVGYVFETLVVVISTLLTWWSIRTFSLPRGLIGVTQIDPSNFYKDVEGQAARRKRETKRRYLLSLDGGSTGGLSQVFILYEIANRIKYDLKLDEWPRLCDYFDMIGGVGMGGWLAILVGRLGLTPPQAKEEYIATMKLWRTRDSQLLERFLKHVIKKYTSNSETLMFERESATAHCHTFVGATTTGDVTYLIKFRSYEVREAPTVNCPIWQVAYAALAYPNTLAPVKVGENLVEQIFISGEIGWSNPSHEMVREFEAKWPRHKLACLVSIGAGHDGPVQIDAEDIESTFTIAMERIATNRERIAQDIAYRFQECDMYFRLNVERGLQQDKKQVTLGDIETRTRSYLCSPAVTESVNKLVDTLLRATEPPEWSMTTEHFEQTLDEYISEAQKWADKARSSEVRTATREVVRILEAIRTATWEEEEWLTLARTIYGHCTSRSLNQSEESPATALWLAMNGYFKELKKIRMKLRSLLKSNPHRVWGLPTHEAFISQSISELDIFEKRIQGSLVSDTHSRMTQRDQDKELKAFSMWLSLLEPHLRHNSVRLNRSPGTGRQFLDSPEFQAWCNQNGQECRVLLAFGKPGAGKTIKCSSAIEHIQNENRGRQKVGNLYLYCDYGDRNSQTGLAMIGALTKQLVWRVLSIPTAVLDLYGQRREDKRSMDEQDAKTIFNLVLGQFDTVYICIDALDECEPESRTQLLHFLRVIFMDSTSIRLFLTGRQSVEAEATDILSNLSLKTISITATEEDIRIYLSQKLERDRYPEAMNESFKNQIVEKLIELSQGLFLPAKLQIQSILELDTMRDRRLALQNTPADLFEAYATTLKRIKQQSGTRPQRALDVLMWIYLGKRPLKVIELQHALAVKPGDTSFNPEGISSEKALVGCCLGLIVVETETSTIRLTHFTLQEYFDKNWRNPDLFPFGHSTIATACLSYLEFDYKFPSVPSEWYLQQDYLKNLGEASSLIEYAVNNMGHHLKTTSDMGLARRCLAMVNQEGKLRLLEIGLNDSDSTALHWAAYFGCNLVVELLLETVKPLQSTVVHQTPPTPPLHATEQNHGKLLSVTLGVDCNVKTAHGHTPLSLAVLNSHEAIVRILLNAPGVDINAGDKSSQHPLVLAARNGHEAVVKTLLNAPGVNVNACDEHRYTPLAHASWNGHEAIVQLLLHATGVDVNTRTAYLYTPLSLAAQNGHKAVVQLLLNVPGIDINAGDKDGYTPLGWASRKGREPIVQLLLNAPGIDIDASNRSGDTPLLLAVRHNYEQIIRLLLKMPGVDVNLKNGKGETPLSLATERGRKTIVRLLRDAAGMDAQ